MSAFETYLPFGQTLPPLGLHKFYVTRIHNGCISKPDTLIINSLFCTDEISPYHGFTPNNDNVNDSWVIGNIGKYPDNNVSIFNRWGELVWKTNGYNNDIENKYWSGRRNVGGNGTLPDGTYFYLITSKGIITKGFVELTR